MIDIPTLKSQHVQNTPRTHDAQQRKVVEAVQCRKCLQNWPCDIIQLIEMVESNDHPGKPETVDQDSEQ